MSSEILFSYFFAVTSIIAAGHIVFKHYERWMDGAIATGAAVAGMTGPFVLLAACFWFKGPLRALLFLLLLAAALALQPMIERQGAREQREHIDMEVERLERAIERDPANPALRTGLAEALYRAGQTDRALEEMERAIAAAPALAPRYQLQVEEWRVLRRNFPPPTSTG